MCASQVEPGNRVGAVPGVAVRGGREVVRAESARESSRGRRPRRTRTCSRPATRLTARRQTAIGNRKLRQAVRRGRSIHAQVQARADRLNTAEKRQPKLLRGGRRRRGAMAGWDGAESPSEERKGLGGGGLVGRPDRGSTGDKRRSRICRPPRKPK